MKDWQILTKVNLGRLSIPAGTSVFDLEHVIFNHLKEQGKIRQFPKCSDPENPHQGKPVKIYLHGSSVSWKVVEK